MPTNQEILDLRQQYWKQGYRPVPITNGFKYPKLKKWPELARMNPPHVCTHWPRHWAMGTGILADGLRPIDIDIEDDDLVEQGIGYVVSRFGPAPMRFRENSPRALLLYRATDGTPAKASVKNELTGYGVEILGYGNQFFADGFHTSGVELQWVNHPKYTPRDELAAIDEDGSQELVEFFGRLLNTSNIHHPNMTTYRAAKNSVERPAKTFVGFGAGDWVIGDIKAALAVIPNNGCDWDRWWAIGAGVFDACNGSQAGFEAWERWSHQYRPKSSTPSTAWENMIKKPPAHITAGKLMWYVRQYDPGWVQPSKVLTKLRCFKN